MKLFTIVGTFFLVASAAAVSVGYDEGFDDASRSLAGVTCSDGPNGLVDDFPTHGDLPNFPFIGGVPAIGGWNSPNCGSCWELTYEGNTIHIIGIDKSSTFNIALGAMNALTDNNAEVLGRVEATATEVSRSVCGL